jgi:hypothetical protein
MDVGSEGNTHGSPSYRLLVEQQPNPVDSTVTYRKQQGVPRESLRFCEKNAGEEAYRLTNASA